MKLKKKKEETPVIKKEGISPEDLKEAIEEAEKVVETSNYVETQEQAKAQAITKLTDTRSEITKILTNLNPAEIRALTVMGSIDIYLTEKYKMQSVRGNILREYVKYKISKERKGREGIERISSSTGAEEKLSRLRSIKERMGLG